VAPAPTFVTYGTASRGNSLLAWQTQAWDFVQAVRCKGGGTIKSMTNVILYWALDAHEKSSSVGPSTAVGGGNTSECQCQKCRKGERPPSAGFRHFRHPIPRVSRSPHGRPGNRTARVARCREAVNLMGYYKCHRYYCDGISRLVDAPGISPRRFRSAKDPPGRSMPEVPEAPPLPKSVTPIERRRVCTSPAFVTSGTPSPGQICSPNGHLRPGTHPG
jgi:hypothetical protein